MWGRKGGGVMGDTPEPSKATGGTIGKRRLVGDGDGDGDGGGGRVVSKKHL